MNIRLQKYKANRLAGMNQYNAARAAGYSEITAKHHSDRIEKVIKGDFADALEQAGLTDKYLAQLAKEQLEKSTGMVKHSYFVTVNKLKGRLKDSAKNDEQDLTKINSVQVLIVNKVEHATDLHNTQERGSGQRVDLGAEAVLRFSQQGS